MRLPHIVFLSFAPERGGVTTYQAHQLNHLVGRARATLVDERPETTLDQLAPGVREEITTITLPVWSNARRCAAILLEQWRQDPPDVIAVSNPGLVLLYASLLMAARRLGVRVVNTVHSGVLTPTWRRRVMALGSAIVSMRLDEQVYVTAYTKRYWESRFPWLTYVRSRVVHNGVDVRRDITTSRVLGATVRIGFVGRLHREKGIDLFLALAQVASRPDWEFHVFGDGSEMPAVRASGARVRIHGHETDVRTMFDGIDILVMPSPTENCPYAVLEAKQAGVPSIAASVGGLPEVIAHNVDGLLVASHSATGFLEAIERTVRSYPRLSLGCLQRRRAFDVERQVRATWEPYLPHAWRTAPVTVPAEPPLVGSDT